MAIRFMLSLLFVSFLFSSTILAYNTYEVKSWCSKTRNPQICEYFLSLKQENTTLSIRRKSDFFKVSTQLALEHAILSKANANSLGSKCRNECELAAWKDCLDLYEESIFWLNKTLIMNDKCTQHDAQTWLSTALTNLDTCQTGFIEFGITDNILPLMADNVSELISNSLSINNEPHKEPTKKNGFPTWVKQGDRKLLQSSSSLASQAANVVVAQDGSGNYKTIKDAVAVAWKRSGSDRYVIYVKAGTYSEKIDLGKLENIMFVGDGIGKTIVTGSVSARAGTTTYRTASFAVVGDGFIARDMTFRNTAGPDNHQAVALRSGSDLSVFYRCSFEGYQDTLYVHSQRQFYRECDIYGTVDFIFGNAAVVFQNCNIYGRNSPTKTITVTAQSRTDPGQNTGISVNYCRVIAASDLKPVQSSVRVYLGRPWKKYSRTVFMKTFLDDLINPVGWLPWNGDFALDTLYYGEFMNIGPGSSTASRVDWKGYHVIASASEASKFTVANLIFGDAWLPATNVPFTPGL